MEKPLLHVNQELLMKIEEIEIECWKDYLTGAMDITDNPLGINFSSLGRSTAFLVGASSSLFFNKTLGFGPEHLEKLEDLLTFYHDNEKSCTIELIPRQDEYETLLTLARSGLYNSGYTVILFKEIYELITSLNDNINIEEVDKSETNILADIHVKGFQFQGDESEFEHTIVEEGYKHDNFKCYVAKLENQIIGSGSLYIQGDMGIMFGGATIPEFRGRGGQRALLEYRINEALKMGCKTLVSQTDLFSSSQRNLERVGFQIACNRARWTDYPF